jgi:hypothetical protein
MPLLPGCLENNFVFFSPGVVALLKIPDDVVEV